MDYEQVLPYIPNLRRYARALVGDRDTADDLVQDTLVGPLDIDTVEIEHPRASIHVRGFTADYEPLEILAGRITAEGTRIAEARVVLRPHAGPARPPSFMPGRLSLVLDDMHAARVAIVSPAGFETVFTDIHGSAKVSRTRIEFDGVGVRGTGWAVAGAGGTLYGRDPLALDVRAAWSVGDGNRAAGVAHAVGNLDRLLVDAPIASPGTGRVRAQRTNLAFSSDRKLHVVLGEAHYDPFNLRFI